MDGFLMNGDMFRQVIMDHYKYPNNKVVEHPGDEYVALDGINPSCGDQLTIFVKFNDDIIVDIKFLGNGCSICCASASIMTDELKNKKSNAAHIKIGQFKEMVKDQKYPQNFEDAQAFIGVSSFPARFKCAFLSWDTIDKIIKGE
ncbi:MAG: Fe-S cluster assembly sulfur transfer protein SufU [Mycoplasmatales bacterium]